MARKRVRKNFYKNSRAKRWKKVKERFVLIFKTFLITAAVCLLSLLYILVYDTLTQSSYFNARLILVEGNKRLSQDEVLRQGRLSLGENILAINLSEVRKRLLAHPLIFSANVRRKLPDTIYIRIRERVPVARFDFGQTYFLDSRGEVFGYCDQLRKVEVPLITGLEISDITSAENRSTGFKSVMKVLRLSRLDGSILPLSSIGRIHVDQDLGLTIFMRNSDTKIRLGLGHYQAKFNRLRDVLCYLKRGDKVIYPRSIDVEDVDRVVVKPINPTMISTGVKRKEV
nr:FtsQ-type POTRA domain-containing protein [Desulfobacterales bacterium]